MYRDEAIGPGDKIEIADQAAYSDVSVQISMRVTWQFVECKTTSNRKSVGRNLVVCFDHHRPLSHGHHVPPHVVRVLSGSCAQFKVRYEETESGSQRFSLDFSIDEL